MAQIHALQWSIVFAGALWFTTRWLLERPASRWRHILGGLLAVLLWLPLGYTAGNVGVADGAGGTATFGSDALGTVAIFAAVLSIGALLVGLVLWVEEAADDASDELPGSMRTGRGTRQDD